MGRARTIVLCLGLSATIAIGCLGFWGSGSLSPSWLLPGFDTSRPEFSRIGEQRHVLLFSPTDGERNGAVIAATQHMFEQIAADNSWFVYMTGNAGIFGAETLGEFDAVVFDNHSRGRLTQSQQIALTAFEEAGGGVLWLHEPPAGAEFRKQLAERIRRASQLKQWSR